MATWAIDSFGISGGFLSNLSLRLPKGLICVIGPRGSGKSTLAEAIRLVLGGVPNGAPKPRLDLLKANLGGSVFSLTTIAGTDRERFTIRRTYGQTAILTAADARPVTSVDLDRGTFLPIDAYSSLDIEGIADESLGSKRRTLLDDLCATEMQQIHLKLSDQRRLLEANAESIKATERKIRELTERMEELGDVKAKLEALPPAGKKEGTPEFQAISRQKQFNEKELAAINGATQKLHTLGEELPRLVSRCKAQIGGPMIVADSLNIEIVKPADEALATLWRTLERVVTEASEAVSVAETELSLVSQRLREAHAGQEATYLSLQHMNQEAVKAFEARATAEKESATAETLQEQKAAAAAELATLQEHRKALKAGFILTRDEISELREGVASRLQSEAGAKVRIRVQRNADVLDYQQRMLNALHGTKLKNQDDILRVLLAIRPEDLAVILRDDDLVELGRVDGSRELPDVNETED